jgi:hypothetical protein
MQSMVLMIQRGRSTSPEREQEYAFCLENNESSGLFDKIDVLEARETFFSMFMRANERYWGEVVVIANADIIFDKTIRIAQSLDKAEVLALTRWESDETFYGRSNSQDVWIFIAPILDIPAHFCMGIPGCDNRLAKLLFNAGYLVRNPSLSIKCLHWHLSGHRTYRERERVGGPYLFVEPSTWNNS